MERFWHAPRKLSDARWEFPVARTISKVSYARGLSALLRKLDTQRGLYLSSGYEYPERYSRWDIAAVAPPLEIVASDATSSSPAQ